MRNDFVVYLVAYDVTNNKRLARIAKVAANYGHRLQKSVFHVYLRTNELESMWRELLAVIDPAEDRLILTPLCLRCYHRMRHAGVAPDVSSNSSLIF